MPLPTRVGTLTRNSIRPLDAEEFVRRRCDAHVRRRLVADVLLAVDLLSLAGGTEDVLDGCSRSGWSHATATFELQPGVVECERRRLTHRARLLLEQID